MLSTVIIWKMKRANKKNAHACVRKQIMVKILEISRDI